MINPTFSLEGRRALVTGSTRGIGKAIALALAEAGAEIWIHGTGGGARAEATLEEVRAFGAKADFVEADLGMPEGSARLASSLQEGVDILVLNASVQVRKPWLEIPPEDFELQMRVNVQSSMELMQSFAPSMRGNKWGRILTIGSVQQALPHPQMLVYAASKAAQMSMVINLAKQLAPDGITVNNLAPGVIRTDRNTEALADPDYAEKVRTAIPAGFFGEPEDCSAAALLLCSEAGRYITGQNLYVDGGFGLR